MKTHLASLASGDSANDAPGFINGQTYADAVSLAAVAEAAASLEKYVAQVGELINEAESPEALRRSLLELYRREGEPKVLGDVLERGLLMSELAGRVAVSEDA